MTRTSEGTETGYGPRYFARLWRERMTDGRMGWACATLDNAYESGRGPYGYGMTWDEAMEMFKRARLVHDGTPLDALTEFRIYDPESPRDAQPARIGEAPL